MPIVRIFIITFFLALFRLAAFSQSVHIDTIQSSTQVRFLSLEHAPTFDKKRFWISASSGFGIYAGASYAMWDAWYKDYPLIGFHAFNDMGEWGGMDKMGHLQAAYIQSYYTFKGAQWTGMNRRKAMWTSVGVAMGIQATIEIMDGFSEEWGFSPGDIAFNTMGASLFAVQEMLWQEQRIVMKVSSTQPNYPNMPIYSIDGQQQSSLLDRANELYGSTPSQVFLKDYNAMTIWASFNLRSFSPKKENGKFPTWLNLALGIGADNIYGGFDNAWEDENGNQFLLDKNIYPRYHQFYLSPDIDFSRIPSKHRWVKFALSLVNWIKIPSPALEFNTRGKAHFHAYYW